LTSAVFVILLLLFTEGSVLHFFIFCFYFVLRSIFDRNRMLLSFHQSIPKIPWHVKFVEVCRSEVVLNVLCWSVALSFSFEMSSFAKDEAVPATLFFPPYFLSFNNAYGGSWINQKINFCIDDFFSLFTFLM
jgi:hypothetical protein